LSLGWLWVSASVELDAFSNGEGISKTVSTITFDRDCVRLEPDLTSTALSMGKDFMLKLLTRLGIAFEFSKCCPFFAEGLDHWSACIEGTVETSKGTIKAVWRVDQTSIVGKSDTIDVTADMAIKTNGIYEPFTINFSANVGFRKGGYHYEWNVNPNSSRIKPILNIHKRAWTGSGEVMTGQSPDH
jgi:hypothetical protein